MTHLAAFFPRNITMAAPFSGPFLDASSAKPNALLAHVGGIAIRARKRTALHMMAPQSAETLQVFTLSSDHSILNEHEGLSLVCGHRICDPHHSVPD